jgi:hypothetical protein
MQQNISPKKLLAIHKAMLLGQIIFAAITAFLVYYKSFLPPLEAYNQLLQVLVLLLSLAGFYIGTFVLLKRKISILRLGDFTITEKFKQYSTALIMQWSLLEAPGFFATICFLLVGNFSFLALSFTIMLLFAMTGPTKAKAMLLLQLSEEEYERI